MDVINAQKQAKAKSKADKGQLMYVVLEAEEFIVKNFMEIKEKDDVYSIWRDGAKYEDMKESETTTPTTKMKKVKKEAPKKAVKKTPVKTIRKFEPGKVVSLSIAEMVKKMKNGFYYRDPQGVKQTEAYMASRKNQELVREGMHEYKS